MEGEVLARGHLAQQQQAERVPAELNQRIRLSRFATGIAVTVLMLGFGIRTNDNRCLAQPSTESATVPDWVAGAVFYQVFPERFANGDPANDPTRESLDSPHRVPPNWSVTPWTEDWYHRADWEVAMGDDFFRHGVFERRYGGDLQGVLDRLDYLQDLGVNTLYLNPIFYARSLHKYDGSSLHHVDPYFGPDPAGDLRQIAAESLDSATWEFTAADRLFLKLVAELHRRGMRIVLDGVFNHTGRDFPAFADIAQRQAESVYRDWYVVRRYDDPTTRTNEFRYQGWSGSRSLPEFADTPDGRDLHPRPKQYVFNATQRWMDPNCDGDPADGIDGWRLDVATDMPDQFWVDWNAFARSINPNVYTVAECWDDASQYCTRCGFSATMNYHGFAMPVKAYLVDGRLAPSVAGKLLHERSQAFNPTARHALLSLIDSHDTPRVASMIVNRPRSGTYINPDRFDYDLGKQSSIRHWEEYNVRMPSAVERRIQKMVAVMQVAFVGAPMVYYGTEAGMWGGDDPCDRMPMKWTDIDHDLWQFYRAALKLRQELPALSSDEMEIVSTDDAARALAFKRRGPDRDVYALFNRGRKPTTFEFPCSSGEVTIALTTSGNVEPVCIEHEDGQVRVTLPGLAATLVAPGSKVK